MCSGVQSPEGSVAFAMDETGAGEAKHPNAAMIEFAHGLRVPESAVRLEFISSSGPGGQNVNRRSTRAQLRVRLDGLPLDSAGIERLRRIAGGAKITGDELLISDGQRRSRKQNEAACWARLAALVQAAQKTPKPRRATKPSAGARRRRLEAKKRRGETKQRRKGPEW